MNDFIQFFINLGYSEQEAKLLYKLFLKLNSATVSQAKPLEYRNPYKIPIEQKKRLDRFHKNKNALADALTFGMTPHKNLTAANVGAENIAENLLWTIPLEGLNIGIVRPIVKTFKNSAQPFMNFLWNNGKVIQRKMPYNPNNFYREVSKEAIDDAISSGVVRTNGRFLGPYFAKGNSPLGTKDYIIEGYPNANKWVNADYYHRFVRGYDLPKGGNLFLEENAPFSTYAFPYYKSGVNVTPIGNFTYWQRHPIIGWRLHAFNNVTRAKRVYNTPKVNIMSVEGDITTGGNDYGYLQQDANRSFDLINEHSPSRQLPYTELEIRELPLEYRANARRGNKKFLFRNEDMMEDYFSDSYEFNNNLLDYINNLDIEIAPQFKPLVTDGVVERNPYVAAYRNYLYQNNTDAVSISDDDIAKFLTHMHNMQQQGVTGKMADKLPLWHGSNDMFDVFDWHNTGKYTGNSGALGPGNYFSSNGALYGKPQESNWLPINFQPYYITGIKSTPSGHMMIEKGILPDYMNKQMIKSNPEAFRAMFTRSVPGANTTLYIDPSEAVQGVFSGDRAAFMLRRNTGIKSLFPHPSRLIRNEDGTVQLLPTNWSDPRVNFALGGKLIKRIRK